MKRNDRDRPPATADWGWRYHHIGIPTTVPQPGEFYIAHLKMHVAGFRTSPYGIEWMRFDTDCPVDELIKKVPHVAFQVDDLDAAVNGKELLGEIASPSPGVRVAMIVHAGAPIELIEFQRLEDT